MAVSRATRTAAAFCAATLAIAPGAAGQQEWERQSPWPYPPGSFEGVHMTSPDHIFAVSSGMGGFEDALHESGDGGVTWITRELDLGMDPSYREVWFWDANLGFILGNGSASNLRTTDGGITWQVMADNFAPYSWYGIKLLDGQFGYAHGNGSPAFTQDGGLTWTHPTLEGDPSEPYFAFQRVGGFTSDFGVGLGAGDMGIWRSANRGLFWELVFPDANVGGIIMLDDQVTLAFRPNSVLRTVDQGETWTSIPLPATGSWIPLKFSANVVVAQHWDGTTIRTADGGLTWQRMPDLHSHPFDFELIDSQTALLVQIMGWDFNPALFRTTDAGLTWTAVTSLTTPMLWAVDMFDAQSGFAAGVDNARVLTRDGGVTWTHVDEGSTGYIDDVLMLDDQNGFAVGQGWILRTADGGNNWERAEAVDELFDIDRLASGQLVAVGQDGHYRTSDDNGETWNVRRLFGLDIVRINFEDELEGWLTTGMGNYGYAYRTRDGGQTWVEEFGPTGATIWAIDFGATETYGLIGGGFEGIFRTINGGEDWFYINTVNSHEIYNIHFIDENSVYVAGSHGYFARSDDAGINWDVYDTGIQNAITAMKVVGEDIIWAAATNGITLHSFDGGQTWTVEDTQNETPYWNSFLGIDVRPTGEAWVVGEFGAIFHRPGVIESAPLTDYSIAFGQHIAGGLADLTQSDDARLRGRTRPGFTAIEANLYELRVGARSGSQNAQALNLSLEGRLSQPGGTVRVRLRNWATNGFQQIGQYAIGTTETTVEFTGIDAANRVRAGDGRIELSLRASVLATFSAQGADCSVDHVGVNVQ